MVVNEHAGRVSTGARLTPHHDAASGAGVAFHETMSGYVALGERDPLLGARVARARGTILRLRARIVIPDLDAFLEDPQHEGNLSGVVEGPGIGVARATQGRFVLFGPAPAGYEPGTRVMRYELAIPLEDHGCYLAGEKLVVGGAVTRLWPETTTLLTRIHSGSSSQGEVVGAGVLRLGLGRFLALLITLRGTGGDSAADRRRALLRFGGFFVGRLRDQYAPGRERAERHEG